VVVLLCQGGVVVLRVFRGPEHVTVLATTIMSGSRPTLNHSSVVTGDTGCLGVVQVVGNLALVLCKQGWIMQSCSST